MALTAFQYMVLASTSYYNYEYQTDDDDTNDNFDRIEIYYAEISENEPNIPSGAVTNLLSLPGWAEFVFDDDPEVNFTNIVTFNYEKHVQAPLKLEPGNGSFSFDRSGLDAKIFTDEATTKPPGEPIEVVIAFAGTDRGFNDVTLGFPKDVEVDINLSDGDVTDQAYAALYYTLQAKDQLDLKYGVGNYELSFTGHSLGGHLASVVAAYFGDQLPFTGEAHIFNSAPQNDQIADILTGEGMSGNAVGALDNKFPELALNNIDLNAITINDYHLTNDALRTAGTIGSDNAELANSIANVLDNAVEGLLPSSLGLVIATGGSAAGVLSFDVLLGIAKVYDLRSLNFEAYSLDDYFTNSASNTIDLGADVPFDYLAENLNAFVDVGSIILGQPTLSAKILNAIVNLHLGGQLFFMLDDKVQASNFKNITADEKLPWFWAEAFNADVVGFKTAQFQHPDTQAPHSFFQELIRTRYDANGDLGFVDNFLSQMDIVAGANFDNLLTVDGLIEQDDQNNDIRDSYNIYETVVQHAVMQHTRNQIEVGPPSIDVINSSSDGLLAIDLSLLDLNASDTENYQVETLLSLSLALRDKESFANNITIGDSLLFGFRYLKGEPFFPDVPIVNFVESGDVKKLYLDGSENTGVTVLMDQNATEQTITVTGAGADTITANKGADLIFSGAGDDIIRLGLGIGDNDLVYAGLGNDVIYGSAGDDVIHGSEDLADGVTDNGSDTLNYSELNQGVTVSKTQDLGVFADKGTSGILGRDSIRSIENYVLTDHDDIFFAYDGLITSTTKIGAGAGYDVLNLSPLSAGVTISLSATSGTGFSGFEEVIGTNQGDFIVGSSSGEWLFGGNGIDSLNGNGGNDHLIGGGGSDILDGGSGNDTYYFSLTPKLPLWQQSGSDFISDSSGIDSISLHGGYQFNPTDFTVLGGALLISNVGAVSVANDIENIRYSDGVRYGIDRLILDEGAATEGTETDNGDGTFILDGDEMSNSLTSTFSIGEVYGLGGDDWLYGNSSQVILFGGNGDDYLFGAGLLDGGSGNDYLDGQINDNVVYVESSGIDVISDQGTGGNLEGAGAFTLWKADNGSLVIDYSGGLTSQAVINSTHKAVVLNHFNSQPLEFINGNAVNTFDINVLSSAAADYLVGTEGINTINGGQGNDVIETLGGSDLVFGSAGDDFYTLSAGDHITLNSGSDQIEFGVGAASAGDPLKTFVMHFPEGISSADLVLTRNSEDVGTINIAYGTNGVDLLSASLSPFLELFSEGSVNIEDFTLTTFGTSSNDEIIDFVYLDDNLSPANISQDDIIFAGKGDDDIVVSNGGIDIVYGGEGDDAIGQIERPGFPTTGSVTFYGESGNDFISTLTLSGSLFGGAGNDILISNDTTDILNGGDGDDWISAGNGTDDIQGGKGNDVILNLPGGSKTVDGGAGADLIIFDSDADDIVDGGDGLDIVSFEGALGFSIAQIDLSTQSANIDGTIYSYTNIEGAIGSYGNDTIIGNSANNILDSGTGFNGFLAGNDNLEGGAGSDTYVFGTPFSVRVPPNETPGTPLPPIVGDDIVNDTSGSSDSIEFTEFFTLSDLSFNQVGNDLVISLTEGSVTIIEQFGSGEIENLILADGTILNLSDYNNWTSGTENADTLTGVQAGESIFGLAANDIIDAHVGGNSLYGGLGADTLNGDLGSDILNGGAGDDTVSGGAGDDTYVFSPGDGIDVISETSGFDVLSIKGNTSFSDLTFSQVGNDLQIDIASGVTITDFYAGDSNLLIEEIHFDDGSVFNLTSLIDATPIAVDDTFIGTSAAELFDGGEGNDTVDYAGSDAGLNINLENGVVSGGYAQGDTLISIENIIGSAFKDTIRGDSSNSTLQGGAGQDVIYGGAGADVIDGGSGWDIAHYGDSNVAVNIDMSLATQAGGIAQGDTLIGIEVVTGSIYDDVILGNSARNNLRGNNGNDILRGQNGNDVMSGQNGNDMLYGGNGHDSLYGNAGADALDGEAGVDTAFYVGSNAAVDVDLTRGVQIGGHAQGDTLTSIENVTGSGHGDTITGDSGKNTLKGEAGNDTLNGGAGQDVIYGGAGADVINGGAGWDIVHYGDSNTAVNIDMSLATQAGGIAQGDTLIGIEVVTGSIYDDVILGNSARNNLRGNNGNDILRGQNGNDVMSGQNGNDMLYGGAGNDDLYGNAGSDSFMFEAGTAFTGSDVIKDFSLSQNDKLDVSDLLSSYDAVTDAISDFVQITDNGADSILSVDVDGGADNFVQIATLIGVNGLTDENALETSGNLITA